MADFVEALRREGRGHVPDFDPLDGANEAEILFLLEKPGPMTDSSQGGSGFISRDNDDPTAEAIFTIMRDAGIPRERTLLWNLVPWWNGTTKLTVAEKRRGIAAAVRSSDVAPSLESGRCCR